MSGVRRFFSAMMVMSAMIVVSACGGAGKQPSVASGVDGTKQNAKAPGVAKTYKVKIGLQEIPPDLVYQSKNWGEKYGLDPEIVVFAGGGDIMKALLSGEIQVGNGGSATLVSALAKQPEELRIIATHQFGGDRYGVAVKKGAAYKSIEQLKGKTLGAQLGSGTFETFLIYLQQHNLSQKDFKIINMKVEDLRAALAAGQIDAMVAWEPHIAIAEHLGLAERIISLKDVGDSPNFFLVRTDFAKQNPDAVAAFLASQLDLADYINKDGKAAGKLASDVLKKKGVDLSAEAMDVVFQRLHLERDVNDRLLKELSQVAESMAKENKIKAVPEWKSLVDTSFLTKAGQLRSQ